MERGFKVISASSFKKLVGDDDFKVTYYDINLSTSKTIKCKIKYGDSIVLYGNKVLMWDVEVDCWATIDTYDIQFLELENGTIFDKKDLYELAYKLGELDIDSVELDNSDKSEKNIDSLAKIKDAISLHKKNIKSDYGKGI